MFEIKADHQFPIALLFLLLFISRPITAQNSPDPVSLRFPLLDLPDNAPPRIVIPTMPQSRELTNDWYQGAHYAIAKYGAGHPITSEIADYGFDLFSIWLPFGVSWMHEEWHRAVLSSSGIRSFNEIYAFRLFSPVIKVSGVADNDLAALKRDHPADMVRLAEAGVEGEYARVAAVERDRFFFGVNNYDHLTDILSIVNCIAYEGLSTTEFADRTTRDLLRSENTDERTRDVLGWDFTSWIYDLSRPAEPYAARGIHPSGAGVNRYITTDDLASDEIGFLKLQGWLSLLNLLDPALYGMHEIAKRDGIALGFSCRHLLTSFGYCADLELRMRKSPVNIFIALHNYANHDRYFPGVEAALLQYPIGKFAAISPRCAFWLQPESNRFRTRQSAAGALGEIEITGFPQDLWQPYVSLSGKTAGWSIGEAQLGPAMMVRGGVAMRLPGRVRK